MGKINILSFAVANLIAAGEVVDRPASVIKELLENAIDSGADRITVEIQHGGVTFMRVSDNGGGIAKDDLPLAVRRHATSKIREAGDLEGIATLGFRGEALAAIASVSYMRILSKTPEDTYGAMLEVRGGNILGLAECGSSDGTTVIVEDLFANVPARRKFLKKDITEASAVAVYVEKIALSRPDIAIRFISDGNVKFETAGDGNLKNTIYSLWGRELASRMIAIRGQIEGISVEGFIGRPDHVRASRNYQNFFINGRYIKSKTMTAALEQAFSSYMPTEKFPCCVLNVAINPIAVDVNVHPAKLEVKFSNDKPIFEAIYYSVRSALEENTERPELTLEKPRPAANPFVPIAEARERSLKSRQLSYETPLRQDPIPPSPPISVREVPVSQTPPPSVPDPAPSQPSEPPRPAGTPATEQEELRRYVRDYLARFFAAIEAGVYHGDEILRDAPPSEEQERQALAVEPAAKEAEPVVPPPAPEAIPDPDPALPYYRILGESFHSYVFVEVEGKLLIIDKHAAHERILFETFKRNMKARTAASQELMLPVDVMLTSDELQAVREFKDKIEAVGFRLEVKTYSVAVHAIPVGIGPEEVSDVITTMADRMKENTGSIELTRDLVFERALYQASCKAAIKAGRTYPREDIEWLVARLMEIPDITVCPHGRPVAIEMSKKMLDKQFERI